MKVGLATDLRLFEAEAAIPKVLTHPNQPIQTICPSQLLQSDEITTDIVFHSRYILIEHNNLFVVVY